MSHDPAPLVPARERTGGRRINRIDSPIPNVVAYNYNMDVAGEGLIPSPLFPLMPTAAIYIRVSRADEESIRDNQRRAALEYALKLGYAPEDTRVYDETASGGDAERAGLGLMLRSLRPQELVIFTSLSRMTRGGIGAALDILRQIEAAGAGWHFTEQSILNWDSKTPKLVRDILLAVFASIDEDYRRRISEATRAAMDRKKAAGWHGKGRKPGAKDLRPRKRHGVRLPGIRPPPPEAPSPVAQTSGGV